MDKFKSKNEASVSEEFALLIWSSVGYIWPTPFVQHKDETVCIAIPVGNKYGLH